MQIDLVLREKHLSLAENSPTYWVVSDNDDYVLHIDLDEHRTAMFASFVNNGKAVKCTIDSDGFVLDKNSNRSVPMWALSNPIMTVGVVSDGYASDWVEIPVIWSVKRLYEEEVVQPDDPLAEQLIRLTNDMVAPTIEVETNVGSTYTLRLTDKNGSFVTPNLRGDIGDTITFDDLTEEQKASLKGDRGERGEKGATGDPFTYDMFTEEQLESLRGQQGIQGEPGKPLQITKTYASIAAMNADYSGTDVDVGDFVMIVSTVEDPDNAKMYVKGGEAFVFITDLSGATGIQGERGERGVQGERGNTGVGVSTAAVNASGHLIITKTDNSTIDAGSVIGAQGERGYTGADGVSVVDAGVNNSGHLILAFSNNSTVDAGYVIGEKGDSGDDGSDGADGVGVASATVNGDGNLILTLTNNTTVNAGHVVGADGIQGEDGETGEAGVGVADADVDNSGDLIITLTDDTEINAGHVVGATGSRGVGVSSAAVDANHHLILTLTNAETVDAGYVRGETGETGATGVGVSSATVNASGHLILTLTDSTTVDAGEVKGDKGDAFTYSDFTEQQLAALKGDTGDTGNGIASASVSGGYLTLVYTDGTSSNPLYVKGDTGESGQDGSDGADGKSAYEVAVDEGFVGNEASWLASLVGATGATGKGIASASVSNGHLTLTYTDGTTSSAFYVRGDQGVPGQDGSDGQDYVLTNQDKADIATLTLALLEAAENGSY